MRQFLPVLVGIVIVAGLALMVLLYMDVRSKTHRKEELKQQVEMLYSDVEKLRQDADKVRRLPIPVQYSPETAELDFSRFVDTLRKNKINVDGAKAPVLLGEEAFQSLELKFKVSAGEIKLFQETTIQKAIEILSFLEKDDHLVEMEVVDVAGGKMRPTYEITVKVFYPMVGGEVDEKVTE